MLQTNSSSKLYPESTIEKVEAGQLKTTTSSVSPLLSGLAYPLGQHFLIPLFFGRVAISGQENIPLSGPVILAPTHRARWDALLIPYAAGRCATGRDLHFMVTSSECQGLQGWFVRRLGGFPVDIKRPSISTLRHGVELLLQKKMLVIFPEGGIYRNAEVNSLKQGIARLALTAESTQKELGVKIVPVAISYSQPYPSWGTDVTINIGKPLSAADYLDGGTKDNAKRLTFDLRTALVDLSHHQPKMTTTTFAEIPNS